MRWLLAGLLVAVCGTACGGSHPGDASPAPASDLTVVATTTDAPNAGVPPLRDQARAAGFVDVRTVVPDAIIDLRYATPNNFVGAPLYPPDARCLVHESMAPGLAAAAEQLRPQGEVLVFWDCYRPHDVQARMWEAVPNPAWVARPGTSARSHETGRSVDVTLASPHQQCPPERQVGRLLPRRHGHRLRRLLPPRIRTGNRRRQRGCPIESGAATRRHEHRRVDGVFGRVVAFRRARRVRRPTHSRRAGELS